MPAARATGNAIDAPRGPTQRMLGRRALVVSAAVHVVVIAGLATRAITVPAASPEPSVHAPLEITVVPATVVDEDITVTLLDEPALAAVAAAPAAAVRERGHTRPPAAPSGPSGSTETAISATQTGATGSSETGSPDHGPSKLRMRGPDLSVPAAAVDGFLARSKPLETVPESGRIVQRGRNFIAPDLVTTMTIHDDGTASFHDKPDFEIHFALPMPTAKDLGNMLADWYADPYAQTKARKVQEMAPHEQAIEGGWDAGAGGDGPPGKETQPSGGPTVAIFAGSFDLTAYAMRKFHVGDPYSSRKRKLLAETYEQRAAMGAAHNAHQLDRSAVLMQRNLGGIGSLAPAARRDALFALWDECVEGEGTGGEAGDRARAMVIGWIRAHATQGTADGFTTAEIAAFDARRTSKQHFAPY